MSKLIKPVTQVAETAQRAMGERVAHAVYSSMIGYFEFEDGFSITGTSAPKMSGVGRSRSRSSASSSTSP